MPDLDILKDLRELEFRGIKVPVMRNSMKGAMTLAKHQGYGMPGAEVENTGRGPATFQFSIPFRNGIAGYGVLYPTVFREFWNAFLDTSTGDLLHPEFGYIDVKSDTWDISWDPTRRDGIDFECSFVETLERDMGLEGAADSPITKAIALAEDALKYGAEVELPEYDDGSGSSLSDALKKLKGMQMLADITAAGMLAEIDKTMGAVNTLIDFTNQMTNPKAWPVVQALKGIQTQLMQMRDSAGLSQKQKIEVKTTPQESTPILLASAYGVTIETLFKFNPSLAVSTKVDAGTIVFVPSK